MEEGMSRGDEIYGSDGGIIFVFLIIIGIFIFFAILQFKHWLGFNNSTVPEKNTEIEPKKVVDEYSGFSRGQLEYILTEKIKRQKGINHEKVINSLQELDVASLKKHLIEINEKETEELLNKIKNKDYR